MSRASAWSAQSSPSTLLVGSRWRMPSHCPVVPGYCLWVCAARLQTSDAGEIRCSIRGSTLFLAGPLPAGGRAIYVLNGRRWAMLKLAIASILSVLFVPSVVRSDEIVSRCGVTASGFVRTSKETICIYDRLEPLASGSSGSSSYSQPATSTSSPVVSGGTGGAGGSGIPQPIAGGSRGSLYSQSRNLYGPRGGCFRLNSRGNKDYGAC